MRYYLGTSRFYIICIEFPFLEVHVLLLTLLYISPLTHFQQHCMIVKVINFISFSTSSPKLWILLLWGIYVCLICYSHYREIKEFNNELSFYFSEITKIRTLRITSNLVASIVAPDWIVDTCILCVSGLFPQSFPPSNNINIRVVWVAKRRGSQFPCIYEQSLCWSWSITNFLGIFSLHGLLFQTWEKLLLPQMLI